MKSIRLFMLLAATALFITACEKEKETPDTPDEPNTPTLSSEANMTAFTLINGDLSIDGFYYSSTKTYEISYPAYEYDLLTNATAEVTISGGATISPDPSVARDYTVDGGVVYTVTAEDGETTNQYTITIVEAEEVITVKETFEKTFGALGISNAVLTNVGVAFCGSNIVTFDGSVFDLEGNLVGSVNTTGITGAGTSGFQFAGLSNDANGVLAAAVGYDADGNIASGGDDTALTNFYAWFDGYNNAPTAIVTDYAASGLYMCVSGDIKNGPGILNWKVQGSQMHTVYYCPDGNWDNKEWNGPMSGYEANDGNWGQNISFATGDLNDYFIICDSNGDNQGMHVYVRHGINADVTDDVQLSGTAVTDGLAEGGGEYGNYSQGYAKAVVLNGTYYVVVASSGWPCAYLTIQTLDPDEEDHYLLRTVSYDAASCFPSCAFYQDPATGNAYVALLAENFSLILYTIEVQYV